MCIWPLCCNRLLDHIILSVISRGAAVIGVFRKIAFLDDDPANPRRLGPCQRLEQYRDEWPIAVVGYGTTIEAGATIGPGAVIGHGCIISSGATVARTAQVPDYTMVDCGQTWIADG